MFDDDEEARGMSSDIYYEQPPVTGQIQTRHMHAVQAAFFFLKDPEPCGSAYINKKKRIDPVYK